MTLFTWCLLYLFHCRLCSIKIHFLACVRSDVKTTVSNAYKCSYVYQQLYTRHETNLASNYLHCFDFWHWHRKAWCNACCEMNVSSQKCFMCTILTKNISSPNSLKVWKLCEHTTSFIDNMFTIISNVMLYYPSQFDFLLCLQFQLLISCCLCEKLQKVS